MAWRTRRSSDHPITRSTRLSDLQAEGFDGKAFASEKRVRTVGQLVDKFTATEFVGTFHNFEKLRVVTDLQKAGIGFRPGDTPSYMTVESSTGAWTNVSLLQVFARAVEVADSGVAGAPKLALDDVKSWATLLFFFSHNKGNVYPVTEATGLTGIPPICQSAALANEQSQSFENVRDSANNVMQLTKRVVSISSTKQA